MVRNPPKPNGKLHLSDIAYRNLERMLLRQNFIRESTKHHTIMGTFLNGLEMWSVRWEDARPDYIKEQDAVAAQYGLAPVWNTGDRHICHDGVPVATDYFVRIAHTFNIQTFLVQLTLIRGVNLTRPRAYRPPAPYAITSAVVEAIGLGWLRPTTPLPLRVIDPRTRRVKLILDTRTHVA